MPNAIAPEIKDQFTSKFSEAESPKVLYPLAKKLGVDPASVRRWYQAWLKEIDDAAAEAKQAEIQSELAKIAEMQSEHYGLNEVSNSGALPAFKAEPTDPWKASAWDLPALPKTMAAELVSEIADIDTEILRHRSQISYYSAQVAAEQSSIYPQATTLRSLGDRMRAATEAMEKLFQQRQALIKDGRTRTQRDADEAKANARAEAERAVRRARMLEVDSELAAVAQQLQASCELQRRAFEKFRPLYLERIQLGAEFTSRDARNYADCASMAMHGLAKIELFDVVPSDLQADVCPWAIARKKAI